MWTSLAAMWITSTPALAMESSSEISFSASYWRIGMTFEGKKHLFMPMWEKEDNPLFQNTGLKFTPKGSINPAFGRAGLQVTASPLAILDINAHGGYSAYFGNYQTLVGYPTADTNYGTNEVLETYVDDTGNRSEGTGWNVGGGVTLKAQAGPMIMLVNTDVTHWNVSADVEGDWFFEREQELMLALEGDQVVSVNGILFYEIDKDPADARKLRAGALVTRRHSVAAEDVLLRAGPLVQWTQGEHIVHTMLSQLYLVDRTYDVSMAPFTAYVIKYIP